MLEDFASTETSVVYVPSESVSRRGKKRASEDDFHEQEISVKRESLRLRARSLEDTSQIQSQPTEPANVTRNSPQQSQSINNGTSVNNVASSNSNLVVRSNSKTQIKTPSKSATTSGRSTPNSNRRIVSKSKNENVKIFPHLNPINDAIGPNLICLFVGINPGVKTAETGHAYAHPSNWFWKLLHSSLCTDRLLPPEYDKRLPRLYSLGTTNLVARPTANQTQISQQEKFDSAPILNAKIRKYKPESVCFVGKDIWKCFYKVYFGRNMDESSFKFGWQTIAGGAEDLLIGSRSLGVEECEEEEQDAEEGGNAASSILSTSNIVGSCDSAENQVKIENNSSSTDNQIKIENDGGGGFRNIIKVENKGEIVKLESIPGSDSVVGSWSGLLAAPGTADWQGAKVFVSFSTSGLVSFPPEYKRQVWAELGTFVNERRAARGETSPKEAF
ncbi:hypothetical protein HK100_006030 [Physocladia obscura]|uniref:Uracil-DNA glycosylase-like domain-containing protein n=1 Tax=Physocladia obscura TaxID=109957 RepID=A0AAD5XKN9_9FUNG|nr:hypothetical protein HK100_006030 [Physocladia obscura]